MRIINILLHKGYSKRGHTQTQEVLQFLHLSTFNSNTNSDWNKMTRLPQTHNRLEFWFVSQKEQTRCNLRFFTNAKEKREELKGRIMMKKKFTKKHLQSVISYYNTSDINNYTNIRVPKLVLSYNCIRGRGIIKLFLWAGYSSSQLRGGHHLLILELSWTWQTVDSFVLIPLWGQTPPQRLQALRWRFTV